MIEEKRAAGIRRNSAAEKARLERLQQAALDKEDMEEASRWVREACHDVNASYHCTLTPAQIWSSIPRDILSSCLPD